MTHEVVFAPETQADLLDLYDRFAEDGGEERALAYVERIQATCLRFETFSERGTWRDDIGPEFHVIGFEWRVTIAFHVGAERVTIDRILYGGRDLETAFPP